VTAEQLPGTASIGLEVVVDDRRLVLSPTRPFVIGRGGGVDLELTHPKVSRQHLVLEPGAAGWTATDRSRNGTFLGAERISRLTLTTPTTMRLGGVEDGVQLELVPRQAGGQLAPEARLAGQGRLTGRHQVRAPSIAVGRLPDNDVVLDDLLVSRRHARLDLTASGYRLTDLGTGNGTYVNGRRVTEAMLEPGDVIGIGHSLLQLDGDRLMTYVDTGENTFEADGLSVTTAKGKALLQSVSFSLPGRSLLAVIGPSGAGKSTLLNALIGARPANVGHVRYAGRDLYEDYDELRHRIALVPQDDVLHTQLSVRQALSYAARLRFPADTTEADRRQRVDEVLADLGLSAHADQPITSLSGGQRKRTSVALELLVKPSLLFLDEPTSGLDPGMDRSVMRTLRSLANDGRTVVVVTHNVANLEVCDQLLLLAAGGWVAYFGPPAEALRYFDQPDFADIFILLGTAPGEHWARNFRESADHKRNVGRAADPPRDEQRPPGELPGGSPRQQGPMAQLAVLFRRYVAVIASDRQYAISLAVLPLVMSLLARAVPGSSGLSVAAAMESQDRSPNQLLIVLIIGASLMGAAASVRELVKERPIYQRERAIGLSIGAYLISKVLVLVVITGFQASFFTLISLLGRKSPDDPVVLPWGRVEILVAVLAVTWTSMLAGLVISAAIDNADRGMPLLVLVIMVQLVFCGGLFPVHDRVVIEQLAWLVPSRWGYAMTAATTDLGRLYPSTTDPLWKPTASGWYSNATVLVAIVIVLATLIVVLVARLDPQRRTTTM
jgi:ABC-type multidrug transport system ATPase subunit/pSer/pThr/pTyr-binding forkhead associated (FHA) protein